MMSFQWMNVTFYLEEFDNIIFVFFYDGNANTYSFIKDGVNVKLTHYHKMKSIKEERIKTIGVFSDKGKNRGSSINNLQHCRSFPYLDGEVNINSLSKKEKKSKYKL
jgi:hypothetical protein